MAKGNLFLGTGTGSVGDVTLMRRNGKQVSRVRVRTIANPRSDGQASTRMYTSAVPKFYSPLSVALEKSWEGKNKTDSYAAFLKANIKRLRELGYAVPKSEGFFPIPAQLSQGTLQSPEITANSKSLYFALELGAANVATMGALATALINKYGLQAGDQVTLVGASIAARTAEEYYYPSYERFFLDPESTDAIANMGQFFLQIDGTTLLVSGPDDNLVGFGCIFSRYENGVWRRSTSFMTVFDHIVDEVTSTSGRQRARQSYQNQEVTPISRVYLNGSTAQAEVGTLTLQTKGGASVNIVDLGVEQRTFKKGEDSETVNVYILKSDDNQEYTIQCGNQRSDYDLQIFRPNATANALFESTNLQGGTNNNILTFDSYTASADTVQNFWNWMQGFGVSVSDLTKFFQPGI